MEAESPLGKKGELAKLKQELVLGDRVMRSGFY